MSFVWKSMVIFILLIGWTGDMCIAQWDVPEGKTEQCPTTEATKFRNFKERVFKRLKRRGHGKILIEALQKVAPSEFEKYKDILLPRFKLGKIKEEIKKFRKEIKPLRKKIREKIKELREWLKELRAVETEEDEKTVKSRLHAIGSDIIDAMTQIQALQLEQQKKRLETLKENVSKKEELLKVVEKYKEKIVEYLINKKIGN